MGLDTVELVIAFEEGFGIGIPDADAEKLERPVDVIDYIAHALVGKRYPLCPTQRAFHQIRRAFVETGHTRSAVRVETALSQILPNQGRRAAWRRMQVSLKAAQWPELEPPWWLTRALLVAAFALSGAALWALQMGTAQPMDLEWTKNWLVLPILTFVSTAALLFGLTKPFAAHFPQFPSIRTVGDLALRIDVVGRIRPEHPNETLFAKADR